jgi:Asp-tRNA(Asn)/Glu-tRNA(Gln) amidotransferase A subunit family amidase
MTPAALGSQTGGSVLRPSAYCGVIGFKPSYGLISRAGVVEVSWTFDHIGTLTRSVEDAALLLAQMAGPDDADETTRGFEPLRFETHAPRKPRRACYPKGGVHKYASAEVSDWVDRGVEKLRKSGVEVVETEYPIDFQKLHDRHRMIMNVDGAAYHEKMFSENADKYRPVIRTLVENGLKTGALEYARGLRQRGRLMRELDKVFANFDFIVLPSFQEPPALAEESTGSAFFNEPATQPGLPAITLPLGRGNNNLPFGIQFIGKKLGDIDLLAAAAWCEAELGWRVEIAET